MDNEEDYLAHYGVPGMKWGQRKSPERKGRRNSKRMDKVRQRLRTMSSQTVSAIKKFNAEQEQQRTMKKEAKQLSKTNKKMAKKAKNNLDSLSNEELRDRIARIQLENQYRQLTAKPGDNIKSMIKKKAKEVAVNKLGDILGEVGNIAVNKAKDKINKKAKEKAAAEAAELLAKYSDYTFADIKAFNSKADEVKKLNKFVSVGGEAVLKALDTEKKSREKKKKDKDKENTETDKTASSDDDDKKKKKASE